MKITDVTITQLFCSQNSPVQVSTVSAPRPHTSERGHLFVQTHTDEDAESHPAAVEQSPV